MTSKDLTLRSVCTYIPLILLMVAAVAPDVLGRLCICEDTPFEVDSRPSLLRTKYHLIQIFGSYSFHTTNFYRDQYRGSVFWTEQRLSFPRLSTMTKSRVPLPDPLAVGLLKGLKEINWEDRFDYGVGLEWRPLKNINLDSLPLLKALSHTRLYALRLWTSYLRYEDDWSWRPKVDSRFGLEIYRECNYYNKNRFWGEFWMDVSWRETNFYVKNYDSWFFAMVPKWGVNLTPNSGFATLPYVTTEVVVTGRREFWQNRVMMGIGLRIMPVRWQTGVFGDLFRGSKFYFEYSGVVTYLKDKAPDNNPKSDFQMGFNYTINRW